MVQTGAGDAAVIIDRRGAKGGGGLNYMALGKSVNGRRSEDGDRRKLDNCLPVWTRAHGSVRAREIGSCHSFL